MASPETQQTIETALICNQNLPIIVSIVSCFISFVMLIFSLKSYGKAKDLADHSTKLQADLDDQNNQRHWRREKLYSLADSLYDVATEYWLTDENNLENKKRALAMKSRIEDIEENAKVLSLDVSEPLLTLRHHATGGEFETVRRKALSTDSEKFLYIRLSTNQIKSALS